MNNIKYFIASLLVIGVFFISSCNNDSKDENKIKTDTVTKETSGTKDTAIEIKEVIIDKNTYEPAEENFRNAMNDLYDGHMGVCVGLYLSNPSYAQTSVIMFKQYLDLVDEKYMSGENAISGWSNFSYKFRNYADIVENTGDIDLQRRCLSEFSKLMYNAVNKYGLFDRDTYLFHCPKALNGKGGYWLSDTKEINNPYGEDLIDCAELKGHVKRIPARKEGIY